jgi:hypothetical protein
LIEELIDDESGFIHNRASISDAYVKGNLYGLEAIEKDERLPLTHLWLFKNHLTKTKI